MNFTKCSVLAMAAIAVLPFTGNIVYADDHHSSSHGYSRGSGHGLFNGHNPARTLGLGTHNRRYQSSHTNHNSWSIGRTRGHGGHGGHTGGHSGHHGDH